MEDTNSLPLHRKYRPKGMIQYVGNTKVKESVMKLLEDSVRPQVIFISGESGCGKTSLARLIAKEYSCTNRDKVKGACGVCENCKSITHFIETGESDEWGKVHEIDISEQSGKNDLEGILQDMNIPTFENEWKIYILDEVQEASKGLQNRLLKIVEEPPKGVLMLFCTTHPERILETLRNRCQIKLKITKPKLNEVKGILRYICENENIDCNNKGLDIIAKRSDLVIRTAVMNLDRINKEFGSCTEEAVTQMFVEVSDKFMFDFVHALKNKDTFAYITTLNRIKQMMDLSAFISQLKDFVCKGIYAVNSVDREDITSNEIESFKTLFGELGIDKISYLLQRLLSLDEDNLELDLMLLGYTGLELPQQAQQESFVTEINRELELEQTNAKKELELKEEQAEKQALFDIKSSNDAITEDLILGFGASKVSE